MTTKDQIKAINKAILQLEKLKHNLESGDFDVYGRNRKTAPDTLREVAELISKDVFAPYIKKATKDAKTKRKPAA